MGGPDQKTLVEHGHELMEQQIDELDLTPLKSLKQNTDLSEW